MAMRRSPLKILVQARDMALQSSPEEPQHGWHWLTEWVKAKIPELEEAENILVQSRGDLNAAVKRAQKGIF